MQLLKTSYRAAAALAWATPAQVRHRLGAIGGRLAYLGSRAQARNLRNNYAAILGLPADDPDVKRRARLAFEYCGEMMLEFILISKMSGDEVRDRMKYEGLDNIDRALALGRGVVLTLPHMGNWDMAAAVGALLGYDVHAVAVPFPGSLNEAVISDRARFGMKVIMLDKGAFKAGVEVLRQNKVLALMTDITHGRKGVEVQMFGHRASIPAGPAAFSIRTGAPVLPVCVRRTAPGRYLAQVGGPVQFAATGEERKDTAALSQAIVERFEEFIRDTPEQWFAFRPILTPAASQSGA